MREIEPVKQPVFRFGTVHFAIRPDQVLIDKLDQLSIRPVDTEVDSEQVHRLDDMDFRGNLKDLFSFIFIRCYECTWIMASCLVSPEGKKVLIAGLPGSGKSALAMGLALGHGWRVLNEDRVMIDLNTKRIIPVQMPFIVRSGTAENLHDATGVQLKSLVDDRWCPLGDRFINSESEARFDMAVLIDRWKPRAKLEPVQTGEFVRRLLPLSSVLRHDDGLNKAFEIFGSARCFVLNGGTLKERVGAVINCAQGETS